MNCWLLRHGEAERRASSDAERALTSSGIEEVRDIARHLSGAEVRHVLASPYLRAQQTAMQLCKAASIELPLRTVDWLVPDTPVKRAANELEALGQDGVLLVSHQPLMGALAAYLTQGNTIDSVPFSTGTLAHLQGDHVLGGTMRLVRLDHPGSRSNGR